MIKDNKRIEQTAQQKSRFPIKTNGAAAHMPAVRQRIMNRALISIICAVLFSGCSGGQERVEAVSQARMKPAIPYAPGIEWQFTITPSIIDLGDTAKIDLALTNPTDSQITVASDMFGQFSILIKETAQHFPLAVIPNPPGKFVFAPGATEHIGCSIFTTEQQYRPEGLKGPMGHGLLLLNTGKYHLQLLNRGNAFATIQIEIR